MKYAKSDDGVDISAVKPQAKREQVEEILGPCVRRWESEAGVRYCVYEYDGGYPGDPAEAAAWVALDIISLGLFEVFNAVDDSNLTKRSHVMERIVVSYDSDDTVLGVFDEFDVLPQDESPLDNDRDMEER
jgi:hypothetical protein